MSATADRGVFMSSRKIHRNPLAHSTGSGQATLKVNSRELLPAPFRKGGSPPEAGWGDFILHSPFLILNCYVVHKRPKSPAITA